MSVSTILIVEDEAEASAMLKSILESSGHTVLGPAPDCSSALEILWRERPDFAFVDTHLGSDTCEAVLDECDLQQVPVIITHGALLEMPKFVGARGGVQKPVNGSTIETAIRNLAAA